MGGRQNRQGKDAAGGTTRRRSGGGRVATATKAQRVSGRQVAGQQIYGQQDSAQRGGYFHWTRDLGVSLLSVVPLWLIYEGLRLTLAPEERNGAEALVTESLRPFGPRALLVMDVVLGLVFLVAALSVLRRRVPWGWVTLVTVLEGCTYGLILGPLTQVLTLFLLEQGRAIRMPFAADPVGGCAVLAGTSPVQGDFADLPVRAADLVGSLGAGLFEEAVFRLGVLSLLALGLGTLCRQIGLSRSVGVVAAVIVSSLAFSAFHHVGAGGESYQVGVFWFRAVAGAVLGAVFVLRGFGVVVYTHAAYDVHFYLTHD